MKKFLLRIILLSILIGGIWATWGVYELITNLPNPQRITERSVAESTKIYDRTGEILLYEIHGEEKRTVVSLDSIPEYVKFATLTAEDINFYRHHGLDWRGILRAFLKNLSEGDISQGGSTITQQLIKNSILTKERTYTRKLKEALLAIVMETKYSKDQILELYLNQIPYGSNAYGIEAASQTFFSKPAQELTLGESALLAALPKAPTYYSPYGSNIKELENRKDWILDRMSEGEFVTQKDIDKAKSTQIKITPPRQSIEAPHFVIYVREYLNEKYGEGFVEKNGLKVITTLDYKLQKKAEEAILNGAERNEKLVQAANAALIAIDPKTGEILSMVGSKDYWGNPFSEGCNPGVDCRFDPYPNITTRFRQPGSAFKPFVYATAFKKGYTPETILFDVPTEFNPNCNPDGTPTPVISNPDDCYHPQNYDDTFRGPVTLRQALAQSLNLPSVKLLYLAGLVDSMNTARDLGITTLTNPANYGLSLVLGGAEVTLLEMTSSFGAFAQDGILHPKTAILKIEDSKGQVLEKNENKSRIVLDTEIARTINDVLSDNNARIPMFSPRSSLYFENHQVAAKTGTTQDYRDAWVIGYTPSMAIGVWVGNNDNSPMNQKGLSVMVAGPIWHEVFEYYLKDKAVENFPKPKPKTVEKPILKGLYHSEIVKIDKISKKLATVYTPPELIEEVSFGEVKSILNLINKDNPQGNPPSNPEDNPQYKNWQAAVANWFGTSSSKFSNFNPPKEFDDVHTPEKYPKIDSIAIKSVNTSFLNIEVKLKNTFPLKEVTLFINDELISSKISPISSSLNFQIENLTQEKYRVKVIAHDEVGNKGIKEEEIIVNNQ